MGRAFPPFFFGSFRSERKVNFGTFSLLKQGGRCSLHFLGCPFLMIICLQPIVHVTSFSHCFQTDPYKDRRENIGRLHFPQVRQRYLRVLAGLPGLRVYFLRILHGIVGSKPYRTAGVEVSPQYQYFLRANGIPILFHSFLSSFSSFSSFCSFSSFSSGAIRDAISNFWLARQWCHRTVVANVKRQTPRVFVRRPRWRRQMLRVTV